MMGPIKKPKALSKGLCGGVDTQSRRCMVLGSLVLVLLGCTALYSAMQSQDWTKDELTQRKVFFLAFLLLMASLLLCYWALSGDLDDDAERMEGNRLTAVKHSQYNSIKLESSTINERQRIDTINQGRYIKMLEQSHQQKRNSSNKNRRSGLNQRKISTHSRRCSHTPVISSMDEQKTISTEKQNQIIQSNHQVQIPDHKGKSLIVELMPLLPLQLCEKELSNLNLPIKAFSFDPNNLSSTQHIDRQSSQNHAKPDLPKTFNPVHKNSEAG